METVNFLLALLCVMGFCSLGYSQTTNLTLFQIAPCNGTKTDSVSRFKNDIYAIKPDLSNCNSSSVPGGGGEDYREIVSGHGGIDKNKGLYTPSEKRACDCTNIEIFQRY